MRDAATRIMSASSNGNCIPGELKKLDQWVLWRFEQCTARNGGARQTKVPCQTGGRRASSTNPKAWCSYESAAAILAKNPQQFAGIGFVFAEGDPYCGVDLDNSLNQDGSLKPWADEIVRTLAGGYMEISPSGHGVKVWVKGKLPGAGKRVELSNSERIELYDRGRFFAVTGRLYGRPVEVIGDHQAEIGRLYGRLVRTRPRGAGTLGHQQPEIYTEGGRHDALVREAGRQAQRFGGDTAKTFEAVLQFNSACCRPPKDEREVRSIVEWACSKERGNGSLRANEGPRDSETVEDLILHPADPMPSARIFIDRHYLIDGYRGLQHQAGVFYEYHGQSNAYKDLDEPAVRAKLYMFLEPAKYWTAPKRGNPSELVPFKPTRTKVENVLDALRAVSNLPTSTLPPCWLEPSELNPLDMMACRNGLLHLPDRRLLRPTPHFFTVTGLDFDFSTNAPRPVNWLRFLNELWLEDMASQATLQEWIGYLLTPRTNLQKIFMIVGPKRSGKGTIGRVIRMLLGDRNVCGPTLSNMAEQFGLSILIGKSAAIIADARIGGRTDTATVTERLLSISGEDTLSIPRKYLPDWNGKLPTRFMIMTNELPRIEDVSGALASRFIVLTLSQSFYGREDHGLIEKFIPELPGILLWALEGWDRLQDRGRFIQPNSAAELIQQFEDLGSPIGAFLRECCEVGSGFEVLQSRLFEAWKSWCEENGREHPGNVQMFGRNLRAAVPWLRESQPRVAGTRLRYYQGIRLREGF